jgi:hypothetical protein
MTCMIDFLRRGAVSTSTYDKQNTARLSLADTCVHYHAFKAAQCIVQFHITRVGRTAHTPYMTVCVVISLPKILHVHRIYV